MNSSTCSCGKLKPSLECGLCKTAICKSCANFIESDQFSFLPQVPAELSHSTYCGACFSEKVAPELESYSLLMEKAREITVFEKSQGKETRLLKRTEKPLRVEGCADHDETVLRLAFFAAQKNFNAIIDVNVKAEKVRNQSYQTTVFSGTAVPTDLQTHRLVKDRSIRHNPN